MPGMLNIGNCPTMNATDDTIQVHVIGFEGDCYVGPFFINLEVYMRYMSALCDTATALLDVPAPNQCTRRTYLSVPQRRLCYGAMWRHHQHVVSTQVTAPCTIICMGKNLPFGC